MSSRVYQPLTPNTVRLLRLLQERRPPIEEASSQQRDSDPRISGCTVFCTLSPVSLDNAPAYTALSYNWGGRTKPSAIVVDGVVVMVTENLETALRQLRLADEPLTLWVDALCIDQSNNLEKNGQLRQMRQIYAQAVSVVAWLGPAADNSDVAMQWIKLYGTRSSELRIGARPETHLRRLLETFEVCRRDMVDEEVADFIEDLNFQLSPANAINAHIIEALSKLLQRAYWTRIWVVQEIACASKVLFVCGKSTVREDALHYALRLLRNFRIYHLSKHRLDTAIVKSQAASVFSVETLDPITLLKIRRAAAPLPLIYLMRNLRRFEATDPRDKVFALLGIARDSQALGIHPDYTKLCVDVYINLARELIREGYIELLSLSQLPQRLEGLPSWVPDWSCFTPRSPLQERSLDRSAWPPIVVLEPTFSASSLNNTIEVKSESPIYGSMPLILPATLLGEVCQVGMPWDGEAIGRWMQDLQDLCRMIPSTSSASDERQAFWRTVVTDQDIRQGGKKLRISQEKVRAVAEAFRSEDLRNLDTDSFTAAGLGDYCQQLKSIACGRRPFLISGVYVGLGTQETRLGDLVYILRGAGVPYVLRRGGQSEKFRLIGEAYVYGVMDGEITETDSAIETVTIC